MLKKITADHMIDYTVTVTTVDGTVYKDCDHPDNPFLDTENWFSFWYKGEVYVLPREQVKQVVFTIP